MAANLSDPSSPFLRGGAALALTSCTRCTVRLALSAAMIVVAAARMELTCCSASAGKGFVKMPPKVTDRVFCLRSRHPALRHHHPDRLPPVQRSIGHHCVRVQRRDVPRDRNAGATGATCSPSSATSCPFSLALVSGDAAIVMPFAMGTRTQKRGDRRRRCTRGRSRAVVGMAANPLVPIRLAVIGPARRCPACREKRRRGRAVAQRAPSLCGCPSMKEVTALAASSPPPTSSPPRGRTSPRRCSAP